MNQDEDGDLFDRGMFNHACLSTRRSRPSGFPLSASEMRRYTDHSIPSTHEDCHDDAHLRYGGPTARAAAARASGGLGGLEEESDAHVRYQLPQGARAPLPPAARRTGAAYGAWRG